MIGIGVEMSDCQCCVDVSDQLPAVLIFSGTKSRMDLLELSQSRLSDLGFDVENCFFTRIGSSSPLIAEIFLKILEKYVELLPA